MRTPIIALGIALLLSACATDGKTGKYEQIDWEPPVWSAEGTSTESAADTETDTTIPEWSSVASLAEPLGDDAVKDGLSRWVSLASLLEGRSGREIGAADRKTVDETLKGLVEDHRSGASIQWTGTGSDSQGRLSLTSRYDADHGVLCGVVDHRHRIDGVEVGGRLTACRGPNGDWVIHQVRWWRAGKDIANTGSWQTLGDEMAAPDEDDAGSEDGTWTSITE